MKTLLTGMPYTPSERTDVRKTWEKHGWKPQVANYVHARTNRHAPIEYGDDYDRVMAEDWLSAPGGFRA